MEFLTPALIVALLALYIAYANYRRNNFVVVQIVECTATGLQSATENNWQFFHQFRVLIRNLGIPLHNMTMELCFRETTEHGVLSHYLEKRHDTVGGKDQFAKGMIAEFFLKSYLLKPESFDWLSRLSDPAKQDARFRVYSDGYLAAEIRIASVWDRFKAKWNQIANRVNHLRRRELNSPDGITMVKYTKFLPSFAVVTGWPVKQFTSSLRRDSEKPAEASAGE
jgi:hypothetical protein